MKRLYCLIFSFIILASPAGSLAQPLTGTVSKEEISTTVDINGLTQEDLARLAKKDLVLIIDKSASMNLYCPTKAHGDGVAKLLKHAASLSLNLAVAQAGVIASPCSEWQWVVKQLKTLAIVTDGIYRQGFTVVFFDSRTPLVYQNVSAQNLNKILSFKCPSGGTDMFSPLRDQIFAYFQRREITNGQVKPVVIVIISDGIIGGGKHLQNLIVNATSRMNNADEITICIMQVGMISAGKNAMKKLDNQLMKRGAKYHIVHTCTYSELQQIGLTKAIANALNESPGLF